MKIPVILGPTAVGKSALTLELAASMGGELISCDSRQVYRGMNIGTAKPSAEERNRLKHHVIDIIDPSVEFSAGEWARKAEEAIECTILNGNRPVICGGTFFYFQVLSEGLSCSYPADIPFREEMLALEAVEPGSLHQKLVTLAPEKAKLIHANDIYRVIRSLQNLRDMKNTSAVGEKKEQRYHFVPIVLERERLNLYDRINQRVDSMVEMGLYDEFLSLCERGYNEATPGLKCVGYREFFNYIDSQCTKEFAIEKIKQNTRKFAKRQLTWLRNKSKPELKIDLNSLDIDKSVKKIRSLLDC